jgi:hypothetical protein
MVLPATGLSKPLQLLVMGDKKRQSRLERPGLALNKYYGTKVPSFPITTYQEVRNLVLCRQLDTDSSERQSARQSDDLREPLACDGWRRFDRRRDAGIVADKPP